MRRWIAYWKQTIDAIKPTKKLRIDNNNVKHTDMAKLKMIIWAMKHSMTFYFQHLKMLKG